MIYPHASLPLLGATLLAACAAAPGPDPSASPAPPPGAAPPPASVAAPARSAALPVAAASAPAAASSASASAMPPRAPRASMPASARRWRYQGEGQDGSGGSKTPIQIDLVEIKQSEIDGRPVVQLGVELKGVLLDQEELQAKGFAFAPFPVFASVIVLAGGADKKKPALWLLEGDALPPEAKSA